VTHRFTRSLAQGDFGDLAGDLFGIDSGAQIGLGNDSASSRTPRSASTDQRQRHHALRPAASSARTSWGSMCPSWRRSTAPTTSRTNTAVAWSHCVPRLR
jgi:hypothetical protein